MNEHSFTDNRSGQAERARGTGANASASAKVAGALARLFWAADDDRLAAAIAELAVLHLPPGPLVFAAAWAARALMVALAPEETCRRLAASTGPTQLPLDRIAQALQIPEELSAALAGIDEKAIVLPARVPQANGAWQWWTGGVGRARGVLALRPAGAEDLSPLLEGWGLALTSALRSCWQLAHYRHAAYTDPLTGLPNRRAFVEALRREFRRYRRYGRPFALVFVDLDGFRRVNEIAGHAGGDSVLRAVGQWLADAVRAADLVARVGGDEFAVICPETTADGARAVLQRLQEAVRQITVPCGVQVSLTGGVAEPRPDDQSADAVAQRADAEMLRAKKLRRTAVENEEVG